MHWIIGFIIIAIGFAIFIILQNKKDDKPQEEVKPEPKPEPIPEPKLPELNWNKLIGFASYEAVAKLEFDIILFLNILKEHFINFTRIFSSAHWMDGTPFVKYGDKLDLLNFDEEYFDRLRFFVMEARKRGIIVQVSIFCEQERKWWQNNIQNLPTNTDDWFLASGAMRDMQYKYTWKVWDTLKFCDNVIYEIMNEGRKKEFHREVINWLKGFGNNSLKKISVNRHPPREDDFINFPDVNYIAYHVKESNDVDEYKIVSGKTIISDDGGRPYSVDNQTDMCRKALSKGAGFEHQSDIELQGHNVNLLKDPNWWEYQLLDALARLR